MHVPKLSCSDVLIALSSSWASEPSLYGMGEGIEGGECQLLESASSREWLNALESCGVVIPPLGLSEPPTSSGKA